jgi:hypothetical protein
MILTALLMLLSLAHSWDVDDRCLRRLIEVHHEDFHDVKEDESFLSDEESTRHLTERELKSELSFNMKMHWEEGYCWQEEWKERDWCMECDGDVCEEGDILEIQTCEKVSRQKFNWVPTSGGGRLKTASSNLCLERVGVNEYELRRCSTSSKQILIGFHPSKPFELYPRGDEGKKCIQNEQHHPKADEEIRTNSCDVARAAHASEWEVYWPSTSSGGSSAGGDNPDTPSSGSGSSKPLNKAIRSCSASKPCRECEGDCDSDSECDGKLVCFQKTGNQPVPGCIGSDKSNSDFCVDPKKL